MRVLHAIRSPLAAPTDREPPLTEMSAAQAARAPRAESSAALPDPCVPCRQRAARRLPAAQYQPKAELLADRVLTQAALPCAAARVPTAFAERPRQDPLTQRRRRHAPQTRRIYPLQRVRESLPQDRRRAPPCPMPQERQVRGRPHREQSLRAAVRLRAQTLPMAQAPRQTVRPCVLPAPVRSPRTLLQRVP